MQSTVAVGLLIVLIAFFLPTGAAYNFHRLTDEQEYSISMQQLAESLSSAARVQGGFAGVQVPYSNTNDRRENKFLLWSADDQHPRPYRPRRDLTGFFYKPSRG